MSEFWSEKDYLYWMALDNCTSDLLVEATQSNLPQQKCNLAVEYLAFNDAARDWNATLSNEESKLFDIHTEFSESILRACQRDALCDDSEELVLSEESHQCEGIIAPMRRLPPEVLGEIFSYLTPVLANDHRFDLVKHNYRHPGGRGMRAEIPWYLGQICSYWRTVALSIRSLWSVFDLRPPSHKYHDCRIYCTKYTSSRRPIVYKSEQEEREESWTKVYDAASIESQFLHEPIRPASCEDEAVEGGEEKSRSKGDDAPCIEPQIFENYIPIASCIGPSLDSVEECLQRSGEVPISTRVVYCDSPHTSPFCNALLRRSHRLRHLRLVDIPEDILDRFFESCSRYTQLRSLALIFTSVISPLPTFYCPSSLVNLHLTSVYLTTATHNSIPWAQILKYCEHDCVWDADDDRWASYRQLSNAIELCVQIAKTAQKPQSPVPFPKLRHARLSFQGEHQKEILHSFETPVIESLSYDHSDCFYPEVRLRHSLPHLKTLRVRLKKCSIRCRLNIGYMIDMCPELTEIFIHATEACTDDLVRSLFLAEASPLRLKLEVVRLGLTFRIYDYNEILETVQSSLLSDSKIVSRMREFILYDSGSTSYRTYDSDLEGLQRMREASLSLRIQGLNFFVQSMEQGDADFVEGHWSTCTEPY
ncbi:hypothetical protein B0H12DRAFT_1101440 [Mycena haematopus]|nr:hypothetical protein B0H12DRAFT_1101440 [Mycena haematopus]